MRIRLLQRVLRLFSKERVGSGIIVEENRDFSDFQGVVLLGSFRAFLTCGKNYEVKIKGDDNILPQITIEKDLSGNLVFDNDKNFKIHDDIIVYITLPELSKLKISGKGYIQSENLFSGNNLEMLIYGSGFISLNIDYEKINSKISGSGEIKLEGKTIASDYKISGSGNIYAYSLETKQTSINISGSGNAQLNANSSLSAKISGSGDISYKGNPDEVNKTIHGVGKIQKVD